jgi:cytosol aminopeptidase
MSSADAKRDGLVLGFYEDGTWTKAGQRANDATMGMLRETVQLFKVEGKRGKAVPCILPAETDSLPRRLALVGLGKRPAHVAAQKQADDSNADANDDENDNANDDQDDQDSRSAARLAASVGIQVLKGIGANRIGVEMLNDALGAAEGASLCLYDTNWKGEKAQKKQRVIEVSAFECDNNDVDDWRKGEVLAAAQNFARDLASAPSNLMTPTILCDAVVERFKGAEGVEVRVRDERWIEAERMGSFLAVAKGSLGGDGGERPRMLEIEYCGARASDASKASPLVFVGKGVTFDSGGISIKPSNGMEDMKGDMGGAAAVVGALLGLATLEAPLRAVAIVPLTENMPSASAIKPGDVVTARNGKTIEVINTDAEGRLILADALDYAGQFTPDAIVDVATLTGAMMVALGDSYAGVFSSSDELYADLARAAQRTGEPFWRMPLHASYKSKIDSPVADLRNIGTGRGGGACTAAAFLQEFVPNSVAWAHIDIAGVMDSAGKQPFSPKGMDGKPTRALVEFALEHARSESNSKQ